MFSLNALLFAFLIGFIPILIWLGFWLLQDRKRPEPKHLIVGAFLLGMLAVVLVIPLQGFIASYLNIDIGNLSALNIPLLFVLFLFWAGIEEVFKVLFVFFIIMRKTAVDEPIDIPIYFITAALGFAALENALFLFGPLNDGQMVQGFITGNLRFIGAVLIHTLSTAIVASAVAFSFYKGWYARIRWGVVGLVGATIVHAIFNIALVTTSSDYLLVVFAGVWVGIVVMLLMLEYIKTLQRPAWWKKIFINKK
ncbi:hypothetical protein COU15_01725 [Candidatus Kaiserbacteria bacterium CG10_big_fil_rev_8_21_14_0_10_45_20]|uniref:Protease PrsW n=1 Tax=Candidatus Kaiserbacteria bacterium CG10_big_fil_rev_8_21_14_0_10_45_20 TaxID=1974607 RepID=A0A2H0UFT1_9BACT|nr:MAG: hypothetical protein COU15_01725 [Candidatus Kaiserbacteria bacterium CG10_big_fil_rev_8_21_14_0_10_45_20]